MVYSNMFADKAMGIKYVDEGEEKEKRERVKNKIMGSIKAKDSPMLKRGTSSFEDRIGFLTGRHRGGDDDKVMKMIGKNTEKSKFMNMKKPQNDIFSKVSGFLNKNGPKTEAQNKVSLFLKTKSSPMIKPMKGLKPVNVFAGQDKIRSMLKGYNPENKATNRIRQQFGLKPFGDADGDGVPNILDCQPLNKHKQGVVHDFYNTMTGYITKTPGEVPGDVNVTDPAGVVRQQKRKQPTETTVSPPPAMQTTKTEEPGFISRAGTAIKGVFVDERTAEQKLLDKYPGLTLEQAQELEKQMYASKYKTQPTQSPQMQALRQVAQAPRAIKKGAATSSNVMLSRGQQVDTMALQAARLKTAIGGRRGSFENAMFLAGANKQKAPYRSKVEMVVGQKQPSLSYDEKVLLLMKGQRPQPRTVVPQQYEQPVYEQPTYEQPVSQPSYPQPQRIQYNSEDAPPKGDAPTHMLNPDVKGPYPERAGQKKQYYNWKSRRWIVNPREPYKKHTTTYMPPQQ